eukprot:gene12155-biopygen1888
MDLTAQKRADPDRPESELVRGHFNGNLRGWGCDAVQSEHIRASPEWEAAHGGIGQGSQAETCRGAQRGRD